MIQVKNSDIVTRYWLLNPNTRDVADCPIAVTIFQKHWKILPATNNRAVEPKRLCAREECEIKIQQTTDSRGCLLRCVESWGATIIRALSRLQCIGGISVVSQRRRLLVENSPRGIFYDLLDIFAWNCSIGSIDETSWFSIDQNSFHLAGQENFETCRLRM